MKITGVAPIMAILVWCCTPVKGKQYTASVKNYGPENGMSHREVNTIFQERQGFICFGTKFGLNHFDVLNFTSFTKERNGLNFDNVQGAEGYLWLMEPYGQSHITLFNLLTNKVISFEGKFKNAYKFKDIDTEWIYHSQHMLRLSNLPYGDYQLLIRAQAANGQWLANTLAIKLIVVRPFYMRSWFLIGMVLLVGACIWSWVKWRIWHHKIEQLRLETQIRQAIARIEEDKNIIERQAYALLRLNETRSHFFANISNEFRTHLSVILGMAAQLKDYKPEGQMQQIGKEASLIERNSTNLLRLINQILDLSKIEADQICLHPVQADLVSFTRHIGESFHSMAKARDIQLHFLSEEETCEADFDRDKLQYILSNLLGNALKFTPQGGHIYYRLRLRDGWQPLSLRGYYEELTPTDHQDGQWIQLSVSDTGPGINPASLPKIFARFYQADDQPVSKVSGIELSLVRELVLLMHGGLAVRNQPNGGAKFVVSLPLTRNALPTEELVPVPVLVSPDRSEWIELAPVASGNRPLLLLVEDNHFVALYTQTCIGTHYQVIQADNGHMGFNLALEKMPDIILSDVMMPLMDGFQLCEKLKNDERTSHIPIVLLTARATVSDRIAGLRRGADAYLVKPFQREELLIVLNNLIQNRSLLQIHYSQLALESAQGNPVHAEPEALENQFVIKLRTTIEAQLGNAELSTDTICQLMGMSRTTLHMKMTALTGLSISRYLRSQRLRRAQKLLSSSTLNISEVAYAIGFEDPKYFSRVFSEEFGVSPGNFRNSTKG